MAEERIETPEMKDAKANFVRHLQRARAQGIAIGQKAMATTAMYYLDKIDEDNPETYKDAFEKLKKLCEKTNGFTLEEYVKKMDSIQEMMEIAENAGNDDEINNKEQHKNDGISTESTREAKANEGSEKSNRGNGEAGSDTGSEK